MKHVKLSKTLITGFLIWLVALIYSMVIMTILGLDTTDPNFSFGYQHPQYWTFELIMVPSFLVLALLLFRNYFKNSDIENWKIESWLYGVIVMIVQFAMDVLFIVITFGNGFEYFIGLVTFVYLSIPVWSYFAAIWWKVKG